MTDKTENPAEIYLLPVFDGEHDHVWCDTPAPGEGMREEDATRYVREDIYLAALAQVEQLRKLHCDLTNADMVFDDETHSGYLITNDQLEEMECILGEPTKCLADHDAKVAAKAVDDCTSTHKHNMDLMHALYYAPSSPVSAKKALEIENWFIALELSRQAAKGR